MIAKPGNKTVAPSWPEPYTAIIDVKFVETWAPTNQTFGDIPDFMC